MTSDSMIDYEALAQEAMRNVVRSVLVDAAKSGLPGDHHFYISFDTLAPGVILSKRLREKYAEEMTIVLQHRFWDLIVNEHRFEIKLTFDGIPERLVVPFKAIRVFFDPSVRYGLQFESVTAAQDALDDDAAGLDEAFDDPFANRDFSASNPSPDGRGPSLRPVPEIAGGKARRPKRRNKDVAQTTDTDDDSQLTEISLNIDEPTEPPEAIDDSDNVGAEIVSLDAFRKK